MRKGNEIKRINPGMGLPDISRGGTDPGVLDTGTPPLRGCRNPGRGAVPGWCAPFQVWAETKPEAPCSCGHTGEAG